MSRFRWALGLVPLGALFVAAIVSETPEVEKKVKAAAMAVTHATRASVRVEGRDVYLAVTGMEASAAEKLRGVMADALGIRRVDDKIEIKPAPPTPVPAAVAPVAPPPAPAVAPVAVVAVEPPAPPPVSKPALPVANPYTLSVERTATGLSTAGFAPSEDDRQAFIAALQTAAAPGVVTGALELASGVPEGVDYQSAARFIAVQASRLVSGRAQMTGDMFSITGETPDEPGLAALRGAVSSVLPGGLKLAGVDVRAAPPPPPPVMKPYLFSALRDGNGLTLSGAAPSAEARASLIEAARQAGLVVVDRISINSGEPSGFAAMAAHGLAQLAKLGQGRFTLTDNNYALEGDAPDFASQDSVQAALRALPAGAIAGAMNLNPPVISPFGFSLAREAGAIVLRGVFPDEASREQALEKLRALYPGMEIRAEARIARGAPAGFAGLVNAAIEAFLKLTSGGVAFNGDALSVTGASGSTLASLMQTLSGLLPQGVRLDVVGLQAAPEPKPEPEPAPVAPSVAVAPVAVAPAPVAPAPAAPVLVVPVQAATAPPANAAPACTADAGGVIARADVYFDSGKSTPKPEAAAELARIAGILQACAGTNALASGHTDGAGNRAPNLRLSTQRARVVARMLVKEGAPARRVATISYAWDSPATSPEASESDRARNRRVEILVRQGSN